MNKYQRGEIVIIAINNGVVPDNSPALITNYYRTLDINGNFTYEYELITEKDGILCYFSEGSLSRIEG